MRESKFLGALLPSTPDLLPIIEAVREKYSLHEVVADTDPITEIYLGDEFISLEEFRQEIENRVRENLEFFPPAAVKQYKAAQNIRQLQEVKGIDLLPNDWKQGMQALVALSKSIAEPILQIYDAQIEWVVNMVYTYLLTGETEEAPTDWFSKVITFEIDGEKRIMALASEVTNLDVFIEQIRQEHRKAFGRHRPKLTNTAVTTAHYLQMKRAKTPWNFIVEEYIKRNKISLPRDRTSKRYFDIRRKCEQNLKKRMQRTEAILDVIVRDKK